MRQAALHEEVCGQRGIDFRLFPPLTLLCNVGRHAASPSVTLPWAIEQQHKILTLASTAIGTGNVLLFQLSYLTGGLDELWCVGQQHL